MASEKGASVKHVLVQQQANVRLLHKRQHKKLENDFLHRVQTNKVFSRLLGLLSKRTGLSVEDLHVLVDEICKLCWSEADMLLPEADDQTAPMRLEIQHLKQQLNACALSSQKQIAHVATNHSSASDDAVRDGGVVFHEPLQYLDESTKDAVLSLVLDKIQLVEAGNAPRSLVEALKKRAVRKAPIETIADRELTLDMALETLADVREELKESRAIQADAEEVALLLRQQLKEEEQKVPELREELRALRKKGIQQEQEWRAEKEDLEEELQTAILELKLAQKEKAEDSMRPAHRRFPVEEAMNGIACQTQTDMQGSDVAHQEDVNKYRVMLEEMQMKFKELMQKCRQRGFGAQVEEITHEIGLEEVIGTRAVFQRLYEDAQRRAEKLDRIRAQLQTERDRSASSAKTPREGKLFRRLILDENGEVPVMQAVEESALKGLERIWTEAAQRHYSEASIFIPFVIQAPLPVKAEIPQPRPVIPSSWEFTPARNGFPLSPSGNPRQDAHAARYKRQETSAFISAIDSFQMQDGQPAARFGRQGSSAVSNAEQAVSRLKQHTSNSLPALPASRVATQRLEAAAAPLQRVWEKCEAKPRADAPRKRRTLDEMLS